MKILMIVNPVTPIPPITIGGTERVVQSLVEEYVARGHEVTLLAHDQSSPPQGVRFIGTGTYWHQERMIPRVWSHLLLQGGHYDVIHNHGRLLSWLPRLWGRAAKVHSWHFGDLQEKQVRKLIALKPRRVAFVACGGWITQRYQSLGGQWETIHHGLPETLYRPAFQVAPDAPLVIIGRMDPRKGIPDAIRVARAAKRRLVIAGFVGDLPDEKAWFQENVGRHCDGKDIQFLGTVTDSQKQELLSQAAGYLMPLQASEAFGLVMIEALACGTPVIGYSRYSVPEIVRDGVNGFLVNDESEMVAKVRKLGEIDRQVCRRDFDERFTARRMADRYLALYARLQGAAE